jgi:hypothetical protein
MRNPVEHRICPQVSGLIRSVCLLLAFSCCAPRAFSQETDSSRYPLHVTGAVTITNKGISTIPTFTLGKPALIFDMSLARRKLRFEPQLRFALEGKPWSFLFWWRYPLVETGKFRLRAGAHPALSFKTVLQTTGGVSEKVIVVQRFLAGELSSSYQLTRHVGVGTYYLYSHGLEHNAIQQMHYVGLNPTVSNMALPGQVVLQLHPQVYYLNLDGIDGFYVTSRVVLTKQDFPFVLSAMMNKVLQTRIATSEDFIWNVSLAYAFDL